MVRYIREKEDFPIELIDEKRQEAFIKNNDKKEYVDENSLYKCKKQKDGKNLEPVMESLKKIYRNKCAYCETRFNRTYINIEHYRPKKSDYYENEHRLYHFLAYSWSNLLPICDKCNAKKSNRFDTKNGRVIYNNEPLKELQYITKEYNEIEKALFIHPEVDEYEHLFGFSENGEIIVYENMADSDRMYYTIKYSDLNEEALIDRRAKVLKDFKQMNDELFHLYTIAIKKRDRQIFNYFKNKTEEKIIEFFDDREEFIAVRKYILKEINLFLESLDKKFNEFFKGYLNRHIKTIKVYN